MLTYRLNVASSVHIAPQVARRHGELVEVREQSAAHRATGYAMGPARHPAWIARSAGTLGAMMDGSLERFEELTAEALDELPAWVHERMDNVEVVIEDFPPPEQPNLLGLYQGVPLTNRGDHYFGVVPDRITLFRSTIQMVARDDAGLVREVRRVVVHEVAHFFGISDDRLREMDRY